MPSGFTQPIFAGEAVNPRELTFVVRDDGVTDSDGLSGDQKIIAADRLSRLFEAGPERVIRRSLLRSPITQFGRDDDAGADLRFSDLADVLRHTALRIADEVGHDVGVEQVAHQSSI
jgi:hypothetical protein